MTLRRRSWLVVATISIAAAAACLHSRAWISSFALLAAACFALWTLRRVAARVDNLDDWLVALEGKDPFNPDAKPDYQWRGFATTFVAALSVENHPTLSGSTLVVFRDEIDDDAWRKLVTRVRHGAHTHAHAHTPGKRAFLRRFFE